MIIIIGDAVTEPAIAFPEADADIEPHARVVHVHRKYPSVAAAVCGVGVDLDAGHGIGCAMFASDGPVRTQCHGVGHSRMRAPRVDHVFKIVEERAVAVIEFPQRTPHRLAAGSQCAASDEIVEEEAREATAFRGKCMSAAPPIGRRKDA